MCFTCKAIGNTFSCVDLGECCLPRQCSHLACAIHQSNHLFWFHAHSAPSAAAGWPSQSSESDLKHLPLRLSASLLLQQLCLEKIIGLIKEKNAAEPSSALETRRCSKVGFHIGRAIAGYASDIIEILWVVLHKVDISTASLLASVQSAAHVGNRPGS